MNTTKHDLRKNQILDAAMEVITQHGYENSRMDDIVKSSNMSKGASAKKIKLSKQETKISRIVANELKKKNIYFAGIDFIKGKLIGDINVTSPTGLKTYFDLTGINLAKYFFDNIK